MSRAYKLAYLQGERSISVLVILLPRVARFSQRADQVDKGQRRSGGPLGRSGMCENRNPLADRNYFDMR